MFGGVSLKASILFCFKAIYFVFSVFLPNRTGNDCLCSHCKGGGLAIGAERKLFENAGRLKTFSSNAVGILFVAHGRPSLIL